jgi:hypothetical protein
MAKHEQAQLCVIHAAANPAQQSCIECLLFAVAVNYCCHLLLLLLLPMQAHA